MGNLAKSAHLHILYREKKKDKRGNLMSKYINFV